MKIILGDGNFDIRSPDQRHVTKFAIAGEPEIEMDVKMKVDVEIELTGTVSSTTHPQNLVKRWLPAPLVSSWVENGRP